MAINAKNSICLRWQFPGWRSFLVAVVWVAVVLGGSCPRSQLSGWQLFGVAVVLGGNCPGGNCPGWQLS